LAGTDQNGASADGFCPSARSDLTQERVGTTATLQNVPTMPEKFGQDCSQSLALIGSSSQVVMFQKPLPALRVLQFHWEKAIVGRPVHEARQTRRHSRHSHTVPNAIRPKKGDRCAMARA
jgi:hypothetical protein